MLYDDITAAIGNTPLVRLRGDPAAAMYAKLELQNLFAMKDRVALRVLTDARNSGELAPGAPVVESSSGTMALGLALVGTYLGHPVHIVTDPRVDRMTLTKLEALGCHVHVVPEMTGAGWQSARLERLEDLMRTLHRAYWPRQYSNPRNPAGYWALADELIADLTTFDVLVGAVGSGGSLCGTARALRPRLPDLHVVGVDCVGSVLFAQPDRPRRRQVGLGNSLHPPNLDHDMLDEIQWLNDREAFDATRDLAREQKIFAGNTAGSVYRVMSELAGRFGAGTRVVGIFADRGDRYVGSVYSDDYARIEGLHALPTAERPARIPYGATADRWSRADLRSRSTDRYLLFVESNTTGTGMLALDTAARHGFRPVVLTADPDRYDLREQGRAYADCPTDSVTHLERVVRERFDVAAVAGVTTTSDFYLGAASTLAARLGLPGNPPQVMDRCRDKSAQRTALGAAGVDQPAHAEVADATETAAAVRRVGLPCVVKPADGSGSIDVLLCSDLPQARQQVALVLATTHNARGLPTLGTALVERYVDGPEFSVEMVSRAGTAHLAGVTEKTLGPPPHFVETGHVFPAALDEHVRAAVVAVARSALNALGIDSGVTHTEVRLSPTGPVVIEVNPRPAGGMIPELVRLVTGLDLMELHLLAAVGGDEPIGDATPDGVAAIGFLTADAVGTLTDVTGVDRVQAMAGVEQVAVAARHRPVRPPHDFRDRLGHVIVRGATRQEALGTLAAALSQVSVVTEPAQPVTIASSRPEPPTGAKTPPALAP